MGPLHVRELKSWDDMVYGKATAGLGCSTTAHGSLDFAQILAPGVTSGFYQDAGISGFVAWELLSSDAWWKAGLVSDSRGSCSSICLGPRDSRIRRCRDSTSTVFGGIACVG